MPETPDTAAPRDDAAIWKAVQAERVRAREKHGDTSMEFLSVRDMTRLSVLVEEVGEVAREFNEARHRTHGRLLSQAQRQHAIDLQRLRKELIQVAAMAGAWADNIGEFEDEEARHVV